VNAVQNGAAVDVSTQISSPARPGAKAPTLDFRAVKDSAVRRLDDRQKSRAGRKPAGPSADNMELAAASAGAVAQPAAAQPVQADAALTSTEKEPEISTCCMTAPDMAGKIADILEGFGLLKADGSTRAISQEGLQLLADAYARLMNGQADTDAGAEETVTGSEAGMLKTTTPDEVRRMLQGLINEYFCSLENGGNTAAAQNEVSGGTPLPEEALASPSAEAGNAPPPVPEEAAMFSPAASDTSLAESGALPVAESGNALPSRTDTLVSTAPKEAEMPIAAETPIDAGAAAAQGKDALSQLVKAVQGALKGASGDEAAEKPASSRDTPPVQQNSPDAAGATQTLAFAKPRDALSSDASFSSLETAPKATDADMAENIRNIVERMSYQSGKDTQEFSVSLKPAHLGELSIKLTKSGDGMLAQIKAADADTKGLIQNELASLVEQLKEKGVSLRQIEVTYEAPSFAFNPQQSNGRKQNFEAHSGVKTKAYRAVGAVEAYEAAAPSAPQTLLYADSSVEFQA